MAARHRAPSEAVGASARCIHDGDVGRAVPLDPRQEGRSIAEPEMQGDTLHVASKSRCTADKTSRYNINVCQQPVRATSSQGEPLARKAEDVELRAERTQLADAPAGFLAVRSPRVLPDVTSVSRSAAEREVVEVVAG